MTDELSVMGSDDHRGSSPVDLTEQIHDFEGQLWIEVASRLVGQDDFRVVDDSPGNGQSLLFPVG